MSSLLVSRPAIAPEGPFWIARTGERLLAAALLCAFGPFLLGLGLVILLLSGRPPLIAHRRVGRYGAELWVLKFRTMWERRQKARPGALFSVDYIDDPVGPGLKEPSDPRVRSRFARFCRRHSLDELPQLWHVATGEMSLVGPRPATLVELERIYGSDTEEILSARPGIAGLWQVSGRNWLSMEQRRELDLKCVRDRSPRSYFWILLRTIPEVIHGGNSW